MTALVTKLSQGRPDEGPRLSLRDRASARSDLHTDPDDSRVPRSYGRGTEAPDSGDQPTLVFERALLERLIAATITPGREYLEVTNSPVPVVTTPSAPPRPLSPCMGLSAGPSPLTPLEQAIADLVSRIREPGSDEPLTSTFPESTSPFPESMPELVQHGSPIAQRADPPRAVIPNAPNAAIDSAPIAREVGAASTSHVHLVLDDGAERVVMTVAVRGADVNVSLRTTDEGTATALARNAATLDHALRARGLDLAGFTTERDRDHRERTDHERETPPEPTPFELEETT